MLKLSVADLSVISNTLYGSLGVADGAQLWMYSRETREDTLKKVISLMEELQVQIAELEAQQ